MTSVVLVIAEKNFRDEEYQDPKTVLEGAGIKVITASTTKNKIEGKLGLIVTPDILVQDLNIDQTDALIFIGGGGAEQYFHDKIALNLAKAAKEKGKIYGAICIAPVILANAGLLKDKKATVFSSEIDAIEDQGAIYLAQDVVIDDKLITANGPLAAKKFGQEILKLLS
jgi:protease I